MASLTTKASLCVASEIEGACLYYEKAAHPRVIPAVIIEPLREPVRPKEDFA